jgi:hypothetical protein
MEDLATETGGLGLAGPLSITEGFPSTLLPGPVLDGTLLVFPSTEAPGCEFGALYLIRTDDPFITNEVLYQLS